MNILTIDFETTGLVLHPRTKLDLQPKAIEWGAALINDRGEVLEEQSYIINPGVQIDAVITKITGLTNDDLKDQPPFSHFYPQIKGICAKADILCAHNLPFDQSILEYELERMAVDVFPWPPHRLCTAQVFQEIWGRRPRLLDIYEYSMGVPLEQTHRALDDVRALYAVVLKEHLIDLFLEKLS